MVMRADVAAAALDAALDQNDKSPAIYLSPRGTPLNQRRVRELSEGPGVLLLCARFEGIDQRVIEARNLEEISVGDFVLAGGEVAAMALIEACARLLPGVLGNTESSVDESFARGLLEYPQYTRPADFEGRRIPEVLSSGHHGEIARWRHEQAENLTKQRRPDLWALYERARG
jgi:tRNA (guanine37-N1)-methyltransferase